MTDTTDMTVAAVGVHVLDTHVVGVTGIPDGSDGQLVDTIRLSAAGTAGGTALVLARLGASVRSFGAVGADPIGATLVSLLAAEGVDVRGLVRKDGHQTSASVIPVRPNGDRPAWHCVGANGAFTLDDLDLAALAGVTHLHLGGPEFLGGPAAAELLAHARSLGATTSVDVLAPGDPGLLDWIADALPHTDYLLPNDEQALGFTGAPDLAAAARALLAHGAGCVAVTQGARGALVATPDALFEVAAHPIPPDELVDTTGCGDAFSAGFLRGLSLGHPLPEAARLGCATASLVARSLGTDGGAYSLATALAVTS
ncbi:PfkB family carbohydrate kinase [Actinocorallia sp. API 0066]|uniref:carbohydrate kinase family protein n=1 Tax=Actinocorallia sp. API 0066 TaxID=2896846 RepID=UPI001E55FA9C|nr:PfkB family carbohydrate kinase [Actinocorallia sp. API 0066]MCD0449675.1 PfkB family carbohydrate kinase [Actinocorallia sp. API 0066]